jgi:transportin-3
MTTNGEAGFAPLLEALSTLQRQANPPQKEEAHRYLETFQKSVSCCRSLLMARQRGHTTDIIRRSQAEAWTVTFALLQSKETPAEAKLFAATTLKGKVERPPAHAPSARALVLKLSSAGYL